MVKRNSIMHNERSIATGLKLHLPYPPSVNTYWNFNGSRRFLTAKANKFKADVWALFRETGHKGFADARVGLRICLFPPDNRVRDIDNVLKPLIDALTQAGVFEDDGQVDAIMVFRKEKLPHGHCFVEIFDMNERP